MPGEAVMKISSLKWHYEMKHRNFEETFPQNSEVRTTQINALKSSNEAASRILVTSMTHWNKMCDWSDGHKVGRQTKRGNIQLCILIYVQMEMTFYLVHISLVSLVHNFIVLNEKDIFFWILQYHCMWPDWPQYMDLWVIDKNLCGPLRFIFEYPCYNWITYWITALSFVADMHRYFLLMIILINSYYKLASQLQKKDVMIIMK